MFKSNHFNITVSLLIFMFAFRNVNNQKENKDKWIASKNFRKAKEMADFFMMGLKWVTSLKGEHKLVTLRDVHTEMDTKTNYKLTVEFLAGGNQVNYMYKITNLNS